MFDAGKTRMIELPYGEKTMTTLSRFHTIPACHGQTDRQTGGRMVRQTELLYQCRASVCWRTIKTEFYCDRVNSWERSKLWDLTQMEWKLYEAGSSRLLFIAVWLELRSARKACLLWIIFCAHLHSVALLYYAAVTSALFIRASGQNHNQSPLNIYPKFPVPVINS